MKSDPESGQMKPAPMLFSCRLTLFILCLFSTFTFMLQRVNIGFALVCMVKRTNLTSITNSSLDLILENSAEDFSPSSTDLSFFVDPQETEDETCKRIASSNFANSSSHLVDEGEFEWSKDVQGSILGSFYYGYLFTQIFGGWMAERFGPRLVLLGSILCLSLLTMLNPIAAVYGPEFLFGVRLLMGLTHGGALSAINIFSVRWCASAERAFLMGIAYGGFCFAAAFTFPISALLCKSFGWRYIFYATGSFGLLIAFATFLVAYDWPEDHPRISERELIYLQKSRAVPYATAKASKKQNTPWKKILLSLPINVIYITHACFVWGFLMIGMYLPTFMKEVLYMDTTKNGLYSSLPYIGMLTVHFTVGTFFDFLRRKNFFSLTNLRKLFNTVGMVIPALAMMTIGFVSCSSPASGIIMISIAQAFAEFGFMGGYMFSIFELAPKYAGVLTGMTNTFGVMPGFICPALVAYLTQNGTREEWIVAFIIAGGLMLFGAIVYLIFGSSELQPWAVNSEESVNGNSNLKQQQEMVDLQEKLLAKKNGIASENQNDQNGAAA